MTRARLIPDTITVHVPFRFVTRGGRKEMQLPAGGALQRKTDNTLVKALARAFRWTRMLESGEFATIGDLAAQEKIAPSYMTRVMRLTQLAPEIVEAIVEGRDAAPGLAGLLEPFPVEWTEQLYPALGAAGADRAPVVFEVHAAPEPHQPRDSLALEPQTSEAQCDPT